MENNCLSVQSQDRYNVRTAVDQRGEQTLNRDAKTTGGIKGIASDEAPVIKWTMNRPEQASNTGELLKMCGMDSSSEMYRPSRPSQILQSEKRVSDITRVLREEYINPFDINLDKSSLFNLSSGVAIHDEIADVLSLHKKSDELSKELREQRLLTGEISFNEPIKKQIEKKILTNKKITTVKRSNQVKYIEVNRNILGKLMSYSVNHEKRIDFAEALKYPLSPSPLSISHPDGTKRSCNKSDLLPLLLPNRSNVSGNPCSNNDVSAYIYDVMAGVRTMHNIPDNSSL